jgi:ribonucleoside-diphosphate reductase alpha chain
MSMAGERVGLGMRRLFTREGVHPYDEVEWERRDARIVDARTGEVAFEQRDVEVPAAWSMNATNILAQKYFRGLQGTDGRESSLRQVVDRVVDTVTAWGLRDGYFEDAAEAKVFSDELKWLIITQRAAFNSPVWFNIGVSGVPQQAAACFILSVEDSMASILNWYTEEGIIFKGGSGAGVNLSRIRSSREPLAGGGTASGPVSFMRGADASAGTIKSGGKTRRAAKMVILDADHPDIREFIWCKAREERKARVLQAAGFDMDLDGADGYSLQYQNANNSVRVTDEFMQAVVEGRDWALRARTTGEVLETVTARELFREIAEAAWECADPGLQFDTTINSWHTAPAAGRISASNPCFPGSAKVHTSKGLVPFAELVRRVAAGERIAVYTHDATNPTVPSAQVVLSAPEAVMVTGYQPVVRLRLDNGAELRCTPGHRIFTTNRGYVEAQDLTSDDEVQLLDLEAPAVEADAGLPVNVEAGRGPRAEGELGATSLPEAWTEELAHYLGWVVGAGRATDAAVVTCYRGPEERTEILPLHEELLRQVNRGRPLKVVERPDGTAELCLARRGWAGFLEALGVARDRGVERTVPWAVEQAPPEFAAAFLRGLFDAAGTVVVDPHEGPCASLESSSSALLRSVQTLLATFGVRSRIRSAEGSRRVLLADAGGFARHVGSGLSARQALFGEVVAEGHGAAPAGHTARLVERSEEGVELTFNLSEPRNHSYVVDGVVVRNCSEYVHLDNSSCNLASLNLLRFLDERGDIDVAAFEHAVEVVFTAQEILVGNADYPTERIAETTRRFRELGLGYANLGATLMAKGLPYDSEEGRAFAAAVTALMTGAAYRTSARLAARMGPFAGFHENADAMLEVLRKHRRAVASIDEERAPTALLSAAQEAWDEAVELAERVGVRNSQATVLAPTGTISFLMDCDTTGIEPDLGLVKTKKLVGGGTMTIVNQTVPRALRTLGYGEQEVADIVAWVAEHHSVLGAPHLRAEHLPVFACSMGDNVIHYRGHVRMMAAVQPFISGAISKTVNMPEDATVEDVEQLHLEAWRLGLKAIAIYRDNCKVAQPLSTSRAPNAEGGGEAGGSFGELDALRARIAELEARLATVPTAAPAASSRVRLPRRRRSNTFAFRVADCEGYVTVGEYEDGRPGEVFMKVSKQGSTLSGVMDAFSIAVSLGLQHGVPLSTFVRKYTNMRFEPAGITDDPELRLASSLVDYIFRRLALDYLSPDERLELGVLSSAERSQPVLPGLEELAAREAMRREQERFGEGGDVAGGGRRAAESRDAPFCYSCGNVMQRAGSCYACPSCGATSGCS